VAPEAKENPRHLSMRGFRKAATAMKNCPGKLPGSSQFFPFFSSLFLSPWLLLLGGGLSPFGATTTVFGGLGGRGSSFFCAKALPTRTQPIAAATSFSFKSNIEFPVLLMLSQARMGGRVRDAPASTEQERCQKRNSPSFWQSAFIRGRAGTSLASVSHRFAPVRTVSCKGKAVFH